MLYEYLLLSQPLAIDDMSFEESMKDACQNGDVPGAVVVADGPAMFHYEKAFGMRSQAGERPKDLLQVDAAFRLESCTKLMTTIAALQCVERGLLGLDEDVTRVLPELKNIDILIDFDTSTQRPLLVRSRNKITLRDLMPLGLSRHLLTHTSGLSHPAWNYCLYEYLSSRSRSVTLSCTGRIVRTCLYPLVFEPGTSWEYGAGLEWAGKMVERVNGNISLQQYMEKDIWMPLHMRTATFHLGERPNLEDKVPNMTIREGLNHPIYGTILNPNGRLTPDTSGSAADRIAVVEEVLDEDLEEYSGDDDFGGGGVYCSAPDFARLLRSLCSNDRVLLRPSTVAEMFAPQLSPTARLRLQNFFAIKEIKNIFSAGLPHTVPSLPLDFGLGGLLVMEDVPSEPHMVPLADAGQGSDRRRGRGSMCWSGLPNLYWWMDPVAGVSGFYASQLLPQGDPLSLEMMSQFEEWVYEKASPGQGKSLSGMDMNRGAL